MEEQQIVEALAEALGQVPGAEVSKPRYEAHLGAAVVDALIDVEIAGQKLSLVVEAKNRAAFPRDVRESVWQLRDYLRRIDRGGMRPVPMVAAQSISPGARELLQKEEVGYFDLGGSIFIPIPGAFVLVDRPPPKSGQRKINALFVGRRALVLHAVWENGRDWFGVHEIAERAGVSPGTVSETLILMEQREWLVARGAGPAKERSLAAPAKLLDAWTEYQQNARPADVEYYYVRAVNVYEVSSRLEEFTDKHGALYALTGEAAAQVYAPFVTSVPQLRCRLELGGKGDLVLQEMEARRVQEGWNLALMRPKDRAEFKFRRREDGAWFASPLQAYLDLLQAGGRAKELAEHLRREKLSSW